MQKRKKVRIVFLVIALTIVGGVGFFILQNNDGEIETDVITQDAEKFDFDANVREPASILSVGYERFTHPEYGFSVEYPETLVITAFKEVEGGETIVFQSSADTGIPVSEREGFQVFITPFDEGEKITRERILEDVPFVTVDAPQEVLIGTEAPGDDIPALLFWSEDPRIGKTREVWFVHDRYLYEITAYAHLDLWLAKILLTWEFRK